MAETLQIPPEVRALLLIQDLAINHYMSATEGDPRLRKAKADTAASAAEILKNQLWPNPVTREYSEAEIEAIVRGSI